MEGNFQLALEILKKHYQQCKDLFVKNANCSIVIIEILKQPKKKKKKREREKTKNQLLHGYIMGYFVSLVMIL